MINFVSFLTISTAFQCNITCLPVCQELRGSAEACPCQIQLFACNEMLVMVVCIFLDGG